MSGLDYITLLEKHQLFTIKFTVAVRLCPPAVPENVRVYVPAGVPEGGGVLVVPPPPQPMDRTTESTTAASTGRAASPRVFESHKIMRPRLPNNQSQEVG